MRAGRSFTQLRLLEIACNYGLARTDWLPAPDIELTEDPVPLEFELRYPPPCRLDTLRRLMLFAETLATRAPC